MSDARRIALYTLFFLLLFGGCGDSKKWIGQRRITAVLHLGPNAPHCVIHECLMIDRFTDERCSVTGTISVDECVRIYRVEK